MTGRRMRVACLIKIARLNYLNQCVNSKMYWLQNTNLIKHWSMKVLNITWDLTILILYLLLYILFENQMHRLPCF